MRKFGAGPGTSVLDIGSTRLRKTGCIDSSATCCLSIALVCTMKLFFCYFFLAGVLAGALAIASPVM